VKRPIAERRFDCIDPSGKRFCAVVRIGAPVEHPREGNVGEYSTCPVSMEPLIPEVSAGGGDAFFALCQSIDLVRSVFKGFVASGGRVFHAGSKNAAVNLDDPSFCTWPNREQIGRGRGDKQRIRTGRRTRLSKRRGR
jgi:hypothetical protein